MIFVKFYINKYLRCLHVRFTRDQLLNLSFFLGHNKRKWFYIFSNMLYGVRNKMFIINIDYSLFLLNRTFNFLYYVILKYGLIFAISGFVNYKFSGVTQYFFRKYNFGYYDGKYIGGLVSNLFKVRKTKKRYKYEFVSNFHRIRFIPSCFLIFDSNKFYLSFIEANCLRIPAIGFIDSDLNYRYCFYPIIANNESFFIQFYYLISCIFLKKKVIFLRRLKFFYFYIHIYINILRYKIYLILIRFIFLKSKFDKIVRKKYYWFLRYLLSKYKINFKFLTQTLTFGKIFYYTHFLVLYCFYYLISSRLFFLYKCLKVFKLRRFRKRLKKRRKKIKRYKMYRFKRLIFKLYYNTLYRLRYFRKLMYENELNLENLNLPPIKNKLNHISYERYINPLKERLRWVKYYNNKRLFRMFKQYYYYGFNVYLKLISLYFVKKFFFYNLQFIYRLPYWRSRLLFVSSFPARIVNSFFKNRVFQIRNLFFRQFTFYRRFIYKYKNKRFIVRYFNKKVKKKIYRLKRFRIKLKKNLNKLVFLRRQHKLNLYRLKLLRLKNFFFLQLRRKFDRNKKNKKFFSSSIYRPRVLKRIFLKRKNWYHFKRFRFFFIRFNYKFKVWQYALSYLVRHCLYVRKKFMRPNLNKTLSSLNLVLMLLQKYKYIDTNKKDKS